MTGEQLEQKKYRVAIEFFLCALSAFAVKWKTISNYTSPHNLSGILVSILFTLN